jgi:hypothetical protein
MTPDLLASCETAAAIGNAAFEVGANATSHQSCRRMELEVTRIFETLCTGD